MTTGKRLRADDEILVGVERLARADQFIPVAAWPVGRMPPGRVRRAAHPVQDQDAVAPVGVQLAIGLVDDLDRGDLLAVNELQLVESVGSRLDDAVVSETCRCRDLRKDQ